MLVTFLTGLLFFTVTLAFFSLHVLRVGKCSEQCHVIII